MDWRFEDFYKTFVSGSPEYAACGIALSKHPKDCTYCIKWKEINNKPEPPQHEAENPFDQYVIKE